MVPHLITALNGPINELEQRVLDSTPAIERWVDTLRQQRGWPDDFATVVADKQLWRLACRAQAEIMSLPHNGMLGKVMAAVLGPRLTAYVNLKLEREVRPLDYMAFSRFQHGDKVRVQDVESMRTDLADGQRQGRQMTALQELLARLEAHEVASQANTQS